MLHVFTVTMCVKCMIILLRLKTKAETSWKRLEYIIDYSSTNNRYNFIANIFSALYDVDYSMHLKNPNEFKRIMSVNLQHNELKHYQLNKPIPETLTIEDIISDMQRDRFLVRPDYQRSEVKNILKAS